MRRTERKRGWTAALLVWTLVIWGHSLMNGGASSTESSFVVAWVRPLLALCGLTDPALVTLVVRKCGHFSEYLVMGLLLSLAARPRWSRPRSHVAAVVCYALAVPCIDETIQRFVPGRNGTPVDVLIDLSGCVVGLLIAWAVARRRAR